MRWETAPVGYLARIIAGQSPPSDDVVLAAAGGRPFVQGNAEFGTRSPTPRYACASAPKIAPTGALLLSVRAPVGELNETVDELGIGRGLVALCPRPEALDSRFAWWAVLATRHDLDAVATGSTYPAVTAVDVAAWELPVPPLEEQRRIAEYLDIETGRIDTLIAQNKRADALLEERLRAFVDAQFTGGEADRWGWEAPDGWARKPLHSLSSGLFCDGDWVEAPYITTEGIRLIQTGNIGVGRYKEQGYRYISDDSFRELNCTEVIPGDVLVCRLAEPIGRACVAPDLGVRMITSVDVTILRPTRGILSEYVVAVLSTSRWLAQMAAEGQGGTRSRIARLRLSEMRIPIPSEPEQARVVAAVNEAIDHTAATRRHLARQGELLRERRQALITAAVTGEMEV